jgi:ferritin-like metal-binding protein YciE
MHARLQTAAEDSETHASGNAVERDMKKETKFEDLFSHGLETLYDAEEQIVGALPKMMAAASSEELAGEFASHLEVTKQQIARLESVFEQMGEEPRGRESQAIRGMIADAETLIGEMEKSSTLDVALAAAARKVEHWEIVAYESLSAIAELLGQHDALDQLQQTLEEETQADEGLADLAESIMSGDAAGDEEIEMDEIEIDEGEVEEIERER